MLSNRLDDKFVSVLAFLVASLPDQTVGVPRFRVRLTKDEQSQPSVLIFRGHDFTILSYVIISACKI